jgi:hypothetical protein
MSKNGYVKIPLESEIPTDPTFNSLRVGNIYISPTDAFNNQIVGVNNIESQIMGVSDSLGANTINVNGLVVNNEFILSGQFGPNYFYQINAPFPGELVFLNDTATYQIIFTQIGTIDGITIQFGGTVDFDGKTISIVNRGGPLTNVIFDGQGAAIKGAPANIASSAALQFMYVAPSTAYYRIA